MLMHSPLHVVLGGDGDGGGGPGGDGGGGVDGGDDLNSTVVGQQRLLLDPGHSPRWNDAPLQSNWLMSAHSPPQLVGGGVGGVGDGGRGLVALAPGRGQHRTLAAPGHLLPNVAAPLQRYVFVSMHSPGQLGGVGGGGDGGVVVRALEPGRGQHLIWLAPVHRPVRMAAPLHVYEFTLMHSPAQRGDGGGGGGVDGGGVGRAVACVIGVLLPVGQHLTFHGPVHLPVCVAAPTQLCVWTLIHDPLQEGDGGLGAGVGLGGDFACPLEQHRMLLLPGQRFERNATEQANVRSSLQRPPGNCFPHFVLACLASRSLPPPAALGFVMGFCSTLKLHSVSPLGRKTLEL